MFIRITGRVEEDSRRGVGGVLVSNGELVDRTDSDGYYSLQAVQGDLGHSFVCVTVPDGYRAVDGFFRRVPDRSGRIDFTLVRDPARARRDFSLAQITDTHVSVEEGVAPSRQVLADDLKQLVGQAAPDLIVGTGDLTCLGTIAELTAFRRAVRAIETPVAPVFGGHDGNEELYGRYSVEDAPERPSEAPTCTRNYEEVIGPTNYSFDWGGRHFVTYVSEYRYLSESDWLRQERWLWADLALQPQDREVVLLMHAPPSVAFLDRLRSFNIALVLFGHTHASKLFTHGDTTVAGLPPLCFGGLDASPRGYRLVRFGKDGFDLELRALGGRSPSPRRAKENRRASPAGEPRQVWERALPATIHRAAPVHYDGDLLLSLTDEDNRGRAAVHCVSADTGETKWQTRTDTSVKNSLALASEDRCVAVSIAGRVYCLDTTSGAVIWRTDLPRHPEHWIYTSPAIADGTVYVGSKGGYGAYDLLTGVQQWYTPFAATYDIIADPVGDKFGSYPSPQVYEELLIVFALRRGLLALRRSDGRIAWERPMDIGVQYDTPALAGDLLVTGGDPGKLALLEARSGEIVWHKPLVQGRWAPGTDSHGPPREGEGYGYPSGLTVEAGRIYAATSMGQVRCFDLHTAELRWTFQCGDDLLDMTPGRRGIRSILARPVLLGDTLIACGVDGGIYLLDTPSGECRSRLQLDSPVTAAPCLVGGGFCVGTWDGRLYRFAT